MRVRRDTVGAIKEEVQGRIEIERGSCFGQSELIVVFRPDVYPK